MCCTAISPPRPGEARQFFPPRHRQSDVLSSIAFPGSIIRNDYGFSHENKEFNKLVEYATESAIVFGGAL